MKFAALWAALPAMALVAADVHAQQCTQCNQRGANCGIGPSRHLNCEETYVDNVMWPRQYVGPSRRGICQATDTMVNNGWRRQNLLGPYHFEANGVQLNEAGRLKAEWILTQAPPARRTIYVQHVADQQRTAGRVEAVQQYVANLNGMGSPGDVQETYVRDDGYPASMVDAVFTGFKANQPIPALPANGSLESSN